MPNPSTRPEEVVSDLIATLSDWTAGTNLFRTPAEPAGSQIPNKCVFCWCGEGGPRAEPYMGQNKDYRRIRVRVLTRSTRHLFKAGAADARALYETLHRATVSAYTGYLAALVLSSDPVYIGQDDQEHHRWTFLVELWYVG